MKEETLEGPDGTIALIEDASGNPVRWVMIVSENTYRNLNPGDIFHSATKGRNFRIREDLTVVETPESVNIYQPEVTSPISDKTNDYSTESEKNKEAGKRTLADYLSERLPGGKWVRSFFKHRRDVDQEEDIYTLQVEVETLKEKVRILEQKGQPVNVGGLEQIIDTSVPKLTEKAPSSSTESKVKKPGWMKLLLAVAGVYVAATVLTNIMTDRTKKYTSHDYIDNRSYYSQVETSLEGVIFPLLYSPERKIERIFVMDATLPLPKAYISSESGTYRMVEGVFIHNAIEQQQVPSWTNKQEIGGFEFVDERDNDGVPETVYLLNENLGRIGEVDHSDVPELYKKFLDIKSRINIPEYSRGEQEVSNPLSSERPRPPKRYMMLPSGFDIQRDFGQRYRMRSDPQD